MTFQYKRNGLLVWREPFSFARTSFSNDDDQDNDDDNAISGRVALLWGKGRHWPTKAFEMVETEKDNKLRRANEINGKDQLVQAR